MTKTYRPLFIMRFFGWFWGLLQLGLVTYLLVVKNQLFLRSPLLLIPVVGYAVLILFSFVVGTQARLEISDNGILYHNGGYIISTPWNNVERIGKEIPGVNLPVDGLVLRAPSAVKKSLMASIFWSGKIGKDGVPYTRFIPLQGIWSWNWRKSEMAEDLKRYLPNLF